MSLDVRGYDILADILKRAYNQAARGKGVQRHGDGNPWHEQDIIRIGRQAGIGFNIGQAIKKLSEARGMLERGENAAAQAEMLGAIVYAASAVYVAQTSTVTVEVWHGDNEPAPPAAQPVIWPDA